MDSVKHILADPRTDPPGPVLELQLAKRIEAGGPDAERAREELITRNLRWVAWHVNKIVGSNSQNWDDLFSQAIVGLKRATEKYDYRQGRFTTYSAFWIRQSIERWLRDNQHSVRIPNHLYDKLLNPLWRARKQLGDATPEELADHTGLTLEQVNYGLELEIMVRPTSLDKTQQLAEIETTGLGAILEDPTAEDAFLELESAEDELWLERILNELPTRERQAISLRYGLGLAGEPERTLYEVAVKLGINREEVRVALSLGEKRLRAFIAKDLGNDLSPLSS